MSRMRLSAAVLIAAMALSACSIVKPDPPSVPASPTAPVYPRFVDGRICENVRYDFFDGIITVSSTFKGQPFEGGFVLICASNDGFPLSDGQPSVVLTLYVYDSPDHAQQAFADKGIKPSPKQGFSYGTFDLAVTRSEWNASSDVLTGLVFDGNLRIAAEVREIEPNGQSDDMLKRLTRLLEELIKELRRLTAQTR